MHSARGIQGFIYSRKVPGLLYHTLLLGHDRLLFMHCHPLARHTTFCHSIHALLHGLFRRTCLYFHTNAKVNSMYPSDPNVRSTPHDMLDTQNSLWPSRTSQRTVSRNNSHSILTSFVAMATAVQLTHTRIPDKEILNAKLRRAERERGGRLGRSVGRSPRNNAATKSFRC